MIRQVSTLHNPIFNNEFIQTIIFGILSLGLY